MARTATAAKPTTTISRASGPKPTSDKLELSRADRNYLFDEA